MRPDRILYLKTDDVRLACAGLDPLAAIRDVLIRHATGEAILPSETYMAWSPDDISKPPGGATAGNLETTRSLGMPGLVLRPRPIVGTKIINASIANVRVGLPRASGLTLLFDFYTARPVCILEAATISALRTASVTIVAAELLHEQPIVTAALIGAGTQASAHLELFLSSFPQLSEVRVFDHHPSRASALHESHAAGSRASDVTLVVAESARAAIEGAELVVTVTTTTEGYIPFDWLSPGTTLVNVSLDDPLPDVVFRAGTLVIDDWQLISSDTRRLLGRLYHEGLVCGPDVVAGDGIRKVDATLGDLLLGRHPGRRDPGEVVLVNPFGMAIEDLALGHLVYEFAASTGLGMWLAV
jgi:ornithine cyclodeaminase/alanine dehydrogenase-like protein (mu-crystallin family)